MRRGFIDEEAFKRVSEAVKCGKRDVEVFREMNSHTSGGVSIGFLHIPDRALVERVRSETRKYDVVIPVTGDGRILMILFQSVNRAGTEVAMRRIIKRIQGGVILDVYGAFCFIPEKKKKAGILEGFYRALDMLIVASKGNKQSRMGTIIDEIL